MTQRKKTGGLSRRRRIGWLLVLALALPGGWLHLAEADAAEDWLKVEEEKPLFGESRPKAAPAPAPKKAKPQVNLQKDTEAMKRYLKRFRDALAEASKILDKRDGLVTALEGRDKNFGVLSKTFDDKAKEMIVKAWEQLKKYDPLVKKDPRFKFLDPGQDPGFKKRGDEIMQSGGKMCQMAQKWAKSTDKQQRDKLKADLMKIRDETKQKQGQLRADFQAMVSAMKPIYRALLEAQKELTPKNKQKLIAMYGQIISAILDAHAVIEDIDGTKTPFYDQLQKARNASGMVIRYLDNNPKLPGVPDPQAIRNEVNLATALQPLSSRANRLYSRENSCSNFGGWYTMLENGPGIPAVKLAKTTNNWVVVYSSSKDIFSLATNKMVDIMYRSKVASDEIKERKRFLDLEWQRSRDSLRNDWKCVKKWMSKKPTRYFTGTMRLDFSGRLINPPAAAKCVSRSTRCGTVTAQVEAVADPLNKKIRIVAKAMPKIEILTQRGKGMRCRGPKGTLRYSYNLKYDPNSGAINHRVKGQNVKGRVTSSGLAFEERHTFQNSRGGCGQVGYLVQSRGKLTESAPGDKASGLDEPMDMIPPLGAPEEGVGVTP